MEQKGYLFVPKKHMNLVHLNGSVMCAVDCETTGTDPLKTGLQMMKFFRPQSLIIYLNRIKYILITS